MSHQLFRRSAVALALLAFTTGCLSPFSPHGQDVLNAWERAGNNAHRRYDKYVLGLDWDDPTIEWVDESYATGPMHR
jgi:hypothetical protein